MTTNEKVTFNRLITDKAEGLMEDTKDFVAMRAFGIATVTKRMGEYPVFKIEDLYRNSLRKRAVGSQYAETATDIEMKSFVCADYGVEEPIAFETMEEMGEGYKQQIADKLLINRRTYSSYELGIRGIPTEILSRIADIFDTSTDYLIERTDIKAPYPKTK